MNTQYLYKVHRKRETQMKMTKNTNTASATVTINNQQSTAPPTQHNRACSALQICELCIKIHEPFWIVAVFYVFRILFFGIRLFGFGFYSIFLAASLHLMSLISLTLGFSLCLLSFLVSSSVFQSACLPLCHFYGWTSHWMVEKFCTFTLSLFNLTANIITIIII